MDIRSIKSHHIPLRARVFKRAFDLLISAFGLLVSGWIIILAWIVTSIETGQNGFFRQTRVGLNGNSFNVIKLRTMRDDPKFKSTVTTLHDHRITRSGMFFRRSKIDELPQLFNVFLGQMSLVGPRPDVPGYADQLKGDDAIILTVRPGITGPATLKYSDEEQLLAQQQDPQKYNDEVIYPDKVRLNREYVMNYSFAKDLGYIWQTLFH